MTGYYNAKFERERQERLTPDRIMEIARRDGIFTVSLRYRDEWLQRRCVKLRKAGFLVGGRRIERGELRFYPAVKPPAEQAMMNEVRI